MNATRSFDCHKAIQSIRRSHVIQFLFAYDKSMPSKSRTQNHYFYLSTRCIRNSASCQGIIFLRHQMADAAHAFWMDVYNCTFFISTKHTGLVVVLPAPTQQIYAYIKPSTNAASYNDSPPSECGLVEPRFDFSPILYAVVWLCVCAYEAMDKNCACTNTTTGRQSHRTQTRVRLKWEKFGVTFFFFSRASGRKRIFHIDSAFGCCRFLFAIIASKCNIAIHCCHIVNRYACVRRPSEHSVGTSAIFVQQYHAIGFFRYIFIFISRDSDTHVSAIIHYRYCITWAIQCMCNAFY